MTAPAPGTPGRPSPESAYRILLIEDDQADALLVEELLNDTRLQFELTAMTTSPKPEPSSPITRSTASCSTSTCPTGPAPRPSPPVRELAPHTAVIAFTGLSETQAGSEAMAAGAQDYLVKGKVEADLLRRTVRYAVYRSQTERAAAEAQKARLHAEENARLERGLLPQPILDTSTVTVTTRSLPVAERALLGGDFLDVVESDDGLLHAVVGDVSGHGSDAAAVGVCLRIAWRSLVLGGHHGPDLLHLMERILIAERGPQPLFATCTLLTLDQHAATATLYLVGHHEPLLTTTEGTRELAAAHGMALGIAPELGTWPSTVTPLPTMRRPDPLHRRLHRGTQRLEHRSARRRRTPRTDPRPAANRPGTDKLAVLRLDWDNRQTPIPPLHPAAFRYGPGGRGKRAGDSDVSSPARPGFSNHPACISEAWVHAPSPVSSSRMVRGLDTHLGGD